MLHQTYRKLKYLIANADLATMGTVVAFSLEIASFSGNVPSLNMNVPSLSGNARSFSRNDSAPGGNVFFLSRK
ncbi:hypothetical protein DN068_19580 [Taibaiella soli]|uniref:Uncharacterized protein n=1 Tax=Taibaiella soli TaxID=1649169 RepID=A0A2W2B4P2_9BACT|nr:hypothetical protein DN068_19580 [Taibaiella soli]